MKGSASSHNVISEDSDFPECRAFQSARNRIIGIVKCSMRQHFINSKKQITK